MSATSFVGARIRFSSSCRQPSANSVTMMPAAIVDFEFFLLTSSRNSLIICSPRSGSYAPNTAATKSNSHWSQDSPIVGCPVTSISRSDVNSAIFASATFGKSGSNGISERRPRIRSFQSGQEVDHCGKLLDRLQRGWPNAAKPVGDLVGLLLLASLLALRCGGFVYRLERGRQFLERFRATSQADRGQHAVTPPGLAVAGRLILNHLFKLALVRRGRVELVEHSRYQSAPALGDYRRVGNGHRLGRGRGHRNGLGTHGTQGAHRAYPLFGLGPLPNSALGNLMSISNFADRCFARQVFELDPIPVAS
ncbi:hypothetical protein SPHINGOT1_80172 [Sphingomonas sp. T1]|nr:hypothetical protein SPHINGOT1_80172 [Sphingomonas sp. T1]